MLLLSQGGILERMAERMVSTAPPIQCTRTGLGIGALTEEYTAQAVLMNDAFEAKVRPLFFSHPISPYVCASRKAVRWGLWA
eukprot:COSAG05_NODE_716_length_7804_cov_2.669825_11_plen_82_part_00